MRVVAEAGQCHGGDLATAISMAYHASQAGAWGIKYQMLHPETIASPDAAKYWQDDFGTANQREAFVKAGILPDEAWQEVARACSDYNIEFLATPFDLPAVEKLDALGVNYFKVASGDVTFKQLILEVALTGKTIILSCGAAYREEIARALRWCGSSKVILLACNLAYPTLPEDANMGRIETLAHVFPQCGVGWSDHTSLASAGLAAGALGSTLNEVHFTLNREAPDCADNAMACDPTDLAAYVTASNMGEKLRGSAELVPNVSELPALMGARRSVCASRDIACGETFTADDLVALRPGGGVAPYSMSGLVGQRARRAIPAGTQI